MGINSSAFLRYHPPLYIRNFMLWQGRPPKCPHHLLNYKPPNMEAKKYCEAYIKATELIHQAEKMEREARRMSRSETEELRLEARQIKADAKAMLKIIGELWNKAEKKTTPDAQREKTSKKNMLEKPKHGTKSQNEVPSRDKVRLPPAPKVSEESKRADQIHRRAQAVMDEAQAMMWESNLLVGKEARLLREEAKQLKESAENMMKQASQYCLASEEMRRVQIQKAEKEVQDANTNSRSRPKVIKDRKSGSAKVVKSKADAKK